MADENQEVDNSEIESEAMEMGWVPEDKFTGDKSRWIDAKEFVDRGTHILPIVQASNKKLRQERLTQDKEIATLKEGLNAATAAIKTLKASYDQAAQLQVKQARNELRQQLKSAREAGDLDAELELEDKLDDLKQAEDKSKKENKEEELPVKKEPELHPDFISFLSDNPWADLKSSDFDNKKWKAWIRAGEDLRDDGDKTVGRAFLEKCKELVEEKSNTATRTPSKTEGGNTGGRSNGSRKFDSLPKEAKDACHEDNSTFVGAGKMFKTVKEWEDHYATVYSSQE